MHYNIKGTELDVTPELRSYVERRLEHADKLVGDDSTAHAQVELEYSAVRDGGKYRAEFTVSVGGKVYRAEEWAGAMHEAIDLAIQALVGELRKDKKKSLRVFRHTALKVKEFLRGWRKDV